MAVPVILRKTAKEHQKQVEKVVSTAGAILRMTRSVRPKQVKKGAKVVTVIASLRKNSKTLSTAF
ncbi:hypothetical protein A464_1059 [Salmonella bongori N268-08]|uniref:Uncharacterized protein n=1 Tax=Salmonella bongori N268-08 TaxID=1197719 RepID=S5N6T4_SALBN|nr:hypothetical protein A464_1059 [Salmonella bongori N268-08]